MTAARALAALAAAVLLPISPAAADFKETEARIVAASQETIARLVELREGGDLTPQSAGMIIEEVISPNFDFEVLTRSVLGKSWRKADEQQQEQLIGLFQKLLEKTYAVALSKFSDQSITSEPGSVTGKKGTVSVYVLNNGSKVQIEYLLTESGGDWNITDVRIEKVSLLGNYRRQFNSIVRKSGVDGLIELLRSKV